MMRTFITENLINGDTMNLSLVFLNNIMTLVMAFFIMFTYKITYSGTLYNKKFNVSLGMMTIITTMIMSVISNNIALSLGMVGALSIIRFRTAVKDVRDATFIFWCIAVGIGCGVSQFLLVGIGSATVFVFLLLTRQVVAENKHLLIIQGEIGARNKAEAEVETYFIKKLHLSMKNASRERFELVYVLTQADLSRAKEKHLVDIIEKLVQIKGIEHVNIVEQLDELGR